MTPKTVLILTLPDLQRWMAEHVHIEIFAIDCETTGLDMLDAEIIGVSLATRDDECYISFPHILAENPAVTQKDIYEALKYIILDENILLISHNTSFDMYHLRRAYVDVLGVSAFRPSCANWWDTMFMAALCDENLIGVRVTLPYRKLILITDGEYDGKPLQHWEYEETEVSVGCLSLKALSRFVLNREQRVWDSTFEDWPIEAQADYAADDARNCYDLAIIFSQHLRELDLLSYYETRIAPLSYVVETMERVGIRCNVPLLKQVAGEVEAQLEIIRAELVALVPPTVTYDYALTPPWTKAIFIEIAKAQCWDLPKTPAGALSVTKKVLYDLAQEYPGVVVPWSISVNLEYFTWQDLATATTTAFNPSSTQQLGKYLNSKEYRLPLTATNQYKVDDATLKELASQYPDDPIWKPLFQLRQLDKFLSNYVLNPLESVWEEDTRLHPQWNAAGTATGRFSCTSSRNKQLKHKRGVAFQTIPRPETLKDEGWPYNPREYFCASPGHKLIVADLSQAEVRMLAVMAEDPTLTDAVNSGEDTHSAMALKTYGREFLNADPARQKILRGRSKQNTFGVMYGIGDTSLAENMRCTIQEARDTKESFYNTFRGVKQWKDEWSEHIVQQGYSVTLEGRRRTPVIIVLPPRITQPADTPEGISQRLYHKVWRSSYDRACIKAHMDPADTPREDREQRAIRQGINFMIQGSVGELINSAMIQLVRAGYNRPGHSLIAQVHDELIVEVEDDPEVIENTIMFMESLLEREINEVRFVLDSAVGDTWACGKE